jgi:predicted RNA-binding Zn-ribbon protein involved in translation (DUF1610 family)
MTETECIGCGHQFEAEDYSFGDCPNCGEYQYYWDDDWSEDNDEYYFEGFYWEIKEVLLKE